MKACRQTDRGRMHNSSNLAGNITLLNGNDSDEGGNYSLLLPQPPPAVSLSDDGHVSYLLQDIFYVIVTPAVSLFGCIGNVLNIIVLIRSRQRMKTADGGRDSGTLLGLLVLAISDMLFCAAVFPRAFASIGGNEALFEPNDFRMYYQVYGTGVINTFILTSTWITVAMATMRYKGICHPLSTSKIYKSSCVKLIYFLTVVICILINLPIFWQYKITDFEIDGHVYCLIDIGDFALNSRKGYAFLWFRAIVGIISPALLLLYCNCSLVLALRRSRSIRREGRVRSSVSRNHSRITRLLVVIVILFILLVFPAELMDFCLALIVTNPNKTYIFIMVRSIANFLQVVNFSCNFVVYCALNVHFRNTVKEVMTLKKGRLLVRRSSSILSTSKTEVTRQTWLRDLLPSNTRRNSQIPSTSSPYTFSHRTENRESNPLCSKQQPV